MNELFSSMVTKSPASAGGSWAARLLAHYCEDHRHPVNHVLHVGVGWPMAALAIILAQEVYWPWFLSHTLGMERSVRIALTVASLLPVGLLMGMPYPLGLRAISASVGRTGLRVRA